MMKKVNLWFPMIPDKYRISNPDPKEATAAELIFGS